jgi:hypothetical protein
MSLVVFEKPKFKVKTLLDFHFKGGRYTDLQGPLLTQLREALTDSGVVCDHTVNILVPNHDLGITVHLHDVHVRTPTCEVLFESETDDTPKRLSVRIDAYENFSNSAMRLIFDEVCVQVYEHLAGMFGVVTEQSVKQAVDQAVLRHQV